MVKEIKTRILSVLDKSDRLLIQEEIHQSLAIDEAISYVKEIIKFYKCKNCNK